MRHWLTQFAMWTYADVPHWWHPTRKQVHYATGVAVGLGLMLLGPALEGAADPCIETVASLTGMHLPHTLWASICWGLHAFGMIPLVLHGERLWHQWVLVEEERDKARREEP